jgi:hypothetical protein
MNFHQPVILGRTGLSVGRLGLASGYKAPTAAIEEAFERGCNYFTWGTVIKGFTPQMRDALRNVIVSSWRCSHTPITIFSPSGCSGKA